MKSVQLKLNTSFIKAASCIILAFAADILFFRQNDTGWVTGLFCLLLLAATSISNFAALNNKAGKLLVLLGLGQTIAMVESPGSLNILLFTLIVTATALNNKTSKLNFMHWLKQLSSYILLKGWFRLPKDFLYFLSTNKGIRKSHLITLLLPVVLTAIFIILFYQANPILVQWVDQVDWDFFNFDFIFNNIYRIIFWLVICAGSWALIAPKFKAKSQKIIDREYNGTIDFIFNPSAILYSLVIFNALFLMQNIMDIIFIWGDSKLPEGMTYAQYAHKGAYPLIVTALLAAVFVLIALRPGSTQEKSRALRSLTYVWVGQNIFLVASSILRLSGYIHEFSLTYMRVSAFIWMGLVVIGLALIIYRIYSGKTNIWLINSNFTSLFAVLYITSLVNIGGLIAHYNVASYLEQKDSGKKLDSNYLCQSVGYEAMPEISNLNDKEIFKRCGYYDLSLFLRAQTFSFYDMKAHFEAETHHWRKWTFRKYRTVQKLKSMGAL